MRIVQLTPGTGNFHCGNCMRDNALVNAQRAMGHDVLMAPMYLPHVVDETEAAGETPIFFGGVNVYLQQKLGLFRHTPAWFDRMLNAPRLLRKLADLAGMTSAKDLGELTVSMLRGEEGRQGKEIDKLVAYLKERGGADVVVLSNCLLMGLAKRLRDELGAAVVCTLAGEDAYLDTLIEPYKSQAWGLLQAKANDAAAFIPVSRYYGDVMSERMGLSADLVKPVYNGIDLEGYAPASEDPGYPSIGYMARMCHGKGMHTLVDAFILLKKGGAHPDLRLCLAGSATPEDRPYIEDQKKKIEAAGLVGDVEFLTNIDHHQKQEFLRSLTVMSVPATYGESFGLYLLEAWASGVPVVQPRCAAFPELIEDTRGGTLCEPDDPADLANELEAVLADRVAARDMGAAGRAAVLDRFGVEHMADEVMKVYEQVASQNKSPANPERKGADVA
ncbi:MAG: glycosyltransferase family 4 protein [Planctomycetota bacterium]|jgi:glycosyltransferase involved in cell wall biosynthesis